MRGAGVVGECQDKIISRRTKGLLQVGIFVFYMGRLRGDC